MSLLKGILRRTQHHKAKRHALSEDYIARRATIDGVIFELASTHRDGEYQVERMSQPSSRWKAFFLARLRRHGHEEDTALDQVIRDRKRAEKAYRKQVRQLDFLGAYLLKRQGPIYEHPQYQKKMEYVEKAKQTVSELKEVEKAMRAGFVL